MTTIKQKGVYFMNSKFIDNMSPMSGRVYKNDGSIVNIADLLENIVNSGVTDPEHTKLNVVGFGTASFEANDAENTSKTISIVSATSFSRNTRLLVQNPSTETDLTVKVGFMWEGKTYFADWYTIPKKQTGADGVVMENHVRLLPPLTHDIKIYVSNDQAISTAFDVTCIIQEV